MPITVVQAAPTVENPSLTTASVTLPQATGSGNTLVACITTNANTTVPAVSGITLGGSADHWQAAVTGAGAEFGAAIWYDPGCASGQTAVVVTCTGGVGGQPEIYVAVYEVSGVLTFDKGSSNEAAGVSTWTSGTTGTTTQAAEIFLGAVSGTTSIPTVTGAGSWTTQSSGAGNFDQVSGYQIVSSTGTATFSGTMTTGGYSAIVATFFQGATFTGTATLTGAGTVAALAVQATKATLTGAGTASALATQISGASLAATGTVSALAVQGATAAATGAGTLAALAVQGAKAALTGAGTLTAGAIVPQSLQNATSSPVVTAVDTSAATVTDPRDGTSAVTARATSTPGVSGG